MTIAFLGHEPEAVQGDQVRLRPMTLDDQDLLAAWWQPAYRSEWNDFGMPFRTLAELTEPGGPMATGSLGRLMIERTDTGEPVGSCSANPRQWGPNPLSTAWNIGIELIPSARGRGLGTEAQRLLIDWLFTHTETNRVEASTDVDNHAERRALEKAGLRFEGIALGAQHRGGTWHDLAVFGLTRAGWAEGATGSPAAPSDPR